MQAFNALYGNRQDGVSLEERNELGVRNADVVLTMVPGVPQGVPADAVRVPGTNG